VVHIQYREAGKAGKAGFFDVLAPFAFKTLKNQLFQPSKNACFTEAEFHPVTIIRPLRAT